MKLYMFADRTKNRIVLSADKEGGNLPGEAKNWSYQKSLQVERRAPSRMGFPNDQILDSIEKIGYFPPAIEARELRT